MTCIYWGDAGQSKSTRLATSLEHLVMFGLVVDSDSSQVFKVLSYWRGTSPSCCLWFSKTRVSRVQYMLWFAASTCLVKYFHCVDCSLYICRQSSIEAHSLTNWTSTSTMAMLWAANMMFRHENSVIRLLWRVRSSSVFRLTQLKYGDLTFLHLSVIWIENGEMNVKIERKYHRKRTKLSASKLLEYRVVHCFKLLVGSYLILISIRYSPEMYDLSLVRF
jgi:hypothetical protein